MKKGLMVYSDVEYGRNKSFIEWMVKEFAKKDVEIDVIRKSEFYASNKDYQGEYDFVINRSRDYNLGLLFEMKGFKVFNNSQMTHLSANKLAAYDYARRRGAAYPETLICNCSAEKKDVIRKPVSGYGGRGIRLLKEDETLEEGYLLQEVVENLVGDVRFYIIGNKINVAVLRKPRRGFVSNYSKGNEFSLYDFSKEEEKYVMDFISDLDIDYAGVDFILTEDGKLLFNEVEDVVGSRMLSDLGVNNNVELFVEHVVKNI